MLGAVLLLGGLDEHLLDQCLVAGDTPRATDDTIQHNTRLEGGRGTRADATCVRHNPLAALLQLTLATQHRTKALQCGDQVTEALSAEPCCRHATGAPRLALGRSGLEAIGAKAPHRGTDRVTKTSAWKKR